PDRHDESVGVELSRHLGFHRPADDTPGEQIDDDGNVEPTFGGPEWSKKRCCASYSTPHPGGLCLSGRGDRPVLAPRHRLVIAEPADHRRRAAGIAEGGVASKAEEQRPGP